MKSDTAVTKTVQNNRRNGKRKRRRLGTPKSFSDLLEVLE